MPQNQRTRKKTVDAPRDVRKQKTTVEQISMLQASVLEYLDHKFRILSITIVASIFASNAIVIGAALWWLFN